MNGIKLKKESHSKTLSCESGERKRYGTKRKLKYRLYSLLACIIVLIGTISPAYAADFVYIQPSVNLDTWHITSAVVQANIGLTQHSPELRRVGYDTLKSLAEGSDSLSSSISALKSLDEYVSTYHSEDRKEKEVNGNFFGALFKSNEDYRVLSFPGSGATKSTSSDYEAATEINDALIYDLNEAFDIYLAKNNVSKTKDLKAFYDKMLEFLNSLSLNGDKCTIRDKNGKVFTFTWRVPKTGYSGKDAQYINWGIIVFEAFNNYVLEGNEAVQEDNAYAAPVGQFEKVIVEALGNALNSLRGILGMWSMDDLIYNQGSRSHTYVGGVFPSSWEPIVWALFIVSEAIAAMVIMLAIITNVLKKAAATINTFARLQMMRQVQDIIICAVALSLLPVLLRLLISISGELTSMAFDLVNPTGDKENTISKSVSVFLSGGGTIGGIIGQFLYFGIQVYFNFFYAIRSLSIAVLIILAPIMITFIALSESKKRVAITWAQELMANILIQPIHAFIIAIVLILPSSIHNFDNIIALYALIPITSMVRGLFFGQNGSWIEQAAQKGRARVTGALGATAVAAGGAMVAGGIAAVRGSTSGSASSGNNQGSTNERSNGNTSQETQQGNSNTSSATGSASSTEGTQNTASNTASQTNSNANAATAGATAFNSPGGNQSEPSSEGAISGQGEIPNGTGTGNLGNAVPIRTSHYTRFTDNTTRVPSKLDTKVEQMAQSLGTGIKNTVKATPRFMKGVAKAVPAAMVAGIGGGLTGMGLNSGMQVVNLGHRMVNQNGQVQNRNNRNENGQEEKQTHQGAQQTSDQSVSGNNTAGPQTDSNNAPFAIQDLDSYEQNYNQAQADTVDYSSIGTTAINRDGTQTTEIPEDRMGDVGVSKMQYQKDTGETSVQFDFDKMSGQEKANAQQMLNYYQTGTDAETSALRDMGISDVRPVYKSVGGQKQVVGMTMDVNRKQYAKNFGVNFDSSRKAAAEGRPISVTSKAGEGAQIIPNATAAIDSYAQSKQIDIPASPTRVAVQRATGYNPPTRPVSSAPEHVHASPQTVKQNVTETQVITSPQPMENISPSQRQGQDIRMNIPFEPSEPVVNNPEVSSHGPIAEQVEIPKEPPIMTQPQSVEEYRDILDISPED